MTLAQWEQVKQLFEAALEEEPAQRDALLAKIRVESSEVCREVERLLSRHDSAGSFLNAPAVIGAAPLSTGEILAERFQIIRFIGRGGMGEVFEAEDLELKVRVALKTLRPEIASDERTILRFKQETHLARQVTHPNVCRIFDLDRHRSSPSAEVVFLTMELLDGETLAERLRRCGPLTPADATPILLQVLDGLAAAHKQGIIHRDFKSANVMLVHGEGGATRAVVTDFGLARSLSAGFSSLTLASTGTVVGTPAYMAPELLERGEFTRATDIYSVGVTIHEMLTGSLPSGSGVPMMDSFDGPRTTPKWDAIIARCLQHRPGLRFADAGALAGAIASNTFAWTAKRLIQSFRRLPVALATIALLIALLALSIFRPRHAVPYGEAPRWYEQGADAIREGTYYKATSALSRAVAADKDFILAHARLAEAWAELQYTDKATEEMVRAMQPDRAGLKVADRLTLQAIGSSVMHEPAKAIGYYLQLLRITPDSERAQVYVDLGRAYESNLESRKAIESYRESAKRAPEYPASFMRLGIVYAKGGRTEEAEAAFQQAESLYQASSNLEGLTELFYQRGRFANSAGQFAFAQLLLQKAVDLARTANNVQQETKALLQLSGVRAQQGDTALATKLSTSAVEKARAAGIDNMLVLGLADLGNSHFVRGDYAKAEDYYSQALELARRYNSASFEAVSLFGLAGLHLKTGKTDQAIQEASQARDFFERAGQRREAARALILIGRTRNSKGDFTGALEAFQNQLKLAEQMQDKAQTAYAHEGIASVYHQQERFPEAVQESREAYRLSSEIKSELQRGYNAVALGNSLWRLGRYDEAEALYREASAAGEKYKFKPLLQMVRIAEAEMDLSRLRFSGSARLSRQALSMTGSERSETVCNIQRILGLAEVGSGAARNGLHLIEEAAGCAAQYGELSLVRSTRLAVIQAALGRGDWQRARSVAAEAQADSNRNGQRHSSWIALLMEARALQIGKNYDESRKIAEQSSIILQTLQDEWAKKGYNSYGLRPDVRQYRRLLDQLLSRKERIPR